MKEHLENLERLLAYHKHAGMGPGSTWADALQYAIDLMNAAKPLDEAAERGHCTAVLFAILDAEGGFGSNAFEDLLIRERAQTRAEGYAQGRADNPNWGNLRRLNEEWEGVERDLKARLSAAQAEIAQNRGAHLDTHNRLRDVAALRDGAEAQLSAAQEEIEILKQNLIHDGSTSRAENVDLETKLTNLRTAAERQRDYRCTYAKFCEAIEASR